MRYCRLIFLCIVLAGCSSGPDVPLPKTTPYDDQPKGRAAYLKGYKEGYRHGFVRGYQWNCFLGLTNLTDVAATFGWNEGMADGRRAKIHRLFEAKRRVP